MNTSPTSNTTRASGAASADASPGTGTPYPKRWEGRLFGGLVLAAFLLYGIGSALVDEPLGVGLVAVNSVAVTIVGVIGFRLLRQHHLWVGAGYLVTRIAEAILLGGGVLIYTIADDASDADVTGYLLAMLALGIGSLPFWYVIGQGPWLSKRFALWGIAGYVLLASGAVIELETGREVTYFFAAPGGLFELAVGIHLLRQGFGTTDQTIKRRGNNSRPNQQGTIQ